jgi:Fe-S-cluster containining protein
MASNKSNKTKKRKEKKPIAKRPITGVNSEKEAKKKDTKVVNLIDKLQDIYNSVDLETTCGGHCVCCNVACPQMNYSEFLVILDNLFNRDDKSSRIDIITKSIRYFFSNSLVKPCPLLQAGRCSVYKERPLSCRMYGQWPEDVYEERVQGFMKATGLKKEEIPLNTQCKFVRRHDVVNDLTKDIIEGLYDDLNDIDKLTGKFNDNQIKQKHNQRTFHDWLMVTIFGEERLSAMSSFYVAAEDALTVLDFVDQLVNQVEETGDDIFRRITGGTDRTTE